jgi:hypothetical protein
VVTDLPPELRAFILDNISSVAQLEALLLLRRSGTEWTLDALHRELRVEREGAAAQLTALVRSGLASMRAGAEPAYRYAPREKRAADLVDALAAAYEDRRVTVIGTIYSRPSDTIRSFADAFRLRKDEDDG